MKIINVTGHSGSGKTTFIRHLIPELIKCGPTATIKHLGHHNFALEPGKDTTLFHEGGALISAGIGSDKTVYICRNPDLNETLDYLCDRGMSYVLIEGFKTLNLPSVVIGDLPARHILFRNPDPKTIVHSMSVFPEYATKKGLEHEVWKRWKAKNPDTPSDQAIIATIAARFDVKDSGGLPGEMIFPAIAGDVSDELSRADTHAVTGISFRAWWVFGGIKELYSSAVASGHESAFNLINVGIALLEERCREKKIRISIEGW
ncbi:MAG TPA: molybdopterin-guanine dinucleotide biosynthesis protein B [Methanoregulaceae archaeon]|nr:molybdopterin-guanine dinucleotide biosynthesis protein B [Methanoregulaceae archaeon]